LEYHVNKEEHGHNFSGKKIQVVIVQSQLKELEKTASTPQQARTMYRFRQHQASRRTKAVKTTSFKPNAHPSVEMDTTN
jgi:hypothetical protein